MLFRSMFVSRCHYLSHRPISEDWDGIFQKRSRRIKLNDLPAKLFLEHAVHEENHLAVVVRDVSETGVLILTGYKNDLYIGERILIELPVDYNVVVDPQRQDTLLATCQVKRKKHGPLFNQKPSWEYGLELNELNWMQQSVLQNFLDHYDALAKNGSLS